MSRRLSLLSWMASIARSSSLLISLYATIKKLPDPHAGSRNVVPASFS